MGYFLQYIQIYFTDYTNILSILFGGVEVLIDSKGLVVKGGEIKSE